MRLVKATLQLRGQGYGFEELDAQLQADAIRLEYGAAAGIVDSHVEVDGAQLQFSGARFGWRIDDGQLGLTRLRLDVPTRTLELERLALRVQGRQHLTTLDAQLDWPALKVVGESLQGAALVGRLALGGDQRLQLQLSSQAPSGVFERITVPALHIDAEGQAGSSSLQGKADATLVISPKPFAVALDPLSLALQMSDPSLPPLHLKLAGNAELTSSTGGGVAEGTINDQRFDARVGATLDRPRAMIDVDASFGTLDLTRFVARSDRASAPATTAAAAPVNLQPLTWADTRMRIKVTRLLWPPYRVDGFDLQASIDNGALDLQQLAGRAWGGRFDARGSANAGSGRLALRLRANDVDLRALLTDTLGFDALRGRGRIDADLRSRGSTVGAVRAALNGRVTLALRPAAIRGIDLAQTFSGWRTAPQGGSTTMAGDAGRQTDFSQLDASLDFRDGVGHSTDLAGRSEFLNVAGEGSIDLARSRIDYLLRARVVNTAGGALARRWSCSTACWCQWNCAVRLATCSGRCAGHRSPPGSWCARSPTWRAVRARRWAACCAARLAPYAAVETTQRRRRHRVDGNAHPESKSAESTNPESGTIATRCPCGAHGREAFAPPRRQRAARPAVTVCCRFRAR